VSTSQLYKQAGNSVTVPLIERLASRVKIALDSKYENSKNQKEEINVTTASES
jgi:hypothetical protein